MMSVITTSHLNIGQLEPREWDRLERGLALWQMPLCLFMTVWTYRLTSSLKLHELASGKKASRSFSWTVCR